MANIKKSESLRELYEYELVRNARGEGSQEWTLYIQSAMRYEELRELGREIDPRLIIEARKEMRTRFIAWDGRIF